MDSCSDISGELGKQLECRHHAFKNSDPKTSNPLEEYRLKLLEEERKALKPKTYQMSSDEEIRAMNFLKARQPSKKHPESH